MAAATTRQSRLKLGIVLDRQILAAHHAIALEPLATELLGGSLRRVGPLDGDAIVLRVLGAEVEGVAGDSHQHGLFRIEHSTRRIHSQTLRVRSLDGPSNATTARIDDLTKRRVNRK